jgi:hypothetical protein
MNSEVENHRAGSRGQRAESIEERQTEKEEKKGVSRKESSK